MSNPSKTESCPLSGAPTDPVHKPFCSRGCKDRDLLNWLGDGYRVPGPPVDPETLPKGEDGLDSER